MSCTVSRSNAPTARIQWMWCSQSTEWNPYSDMKNLIIEEAFANKEDQVMLDDCYIDFKHNLQISNNDQNKQYSIKRVVCNRDDQRVRAERFTFTPVDPRRPFAGMYGWISPFIIEVAKVLNITPDRLPSKDKKMIAFVVEKAAHGIVEEAKLVGEEWEGQRLAQILLKKINEEMKEVWQCCARLYSLDSFLYRTLNATMRLIGNKDHEQVWRSKVRTLGPFCLLLWDSPFNYSSAKPGTILYRGATLTEELITSFKGECSRKSKLIRSFPSFTSCSRIRTRAEEFGNVLFIMTIKHAFTVDLKPFSEYPDEEEELLSPGVCFTVNRVEFDNLKNKYLIYLDLQQQHRRPDGHEISANLQESINLRYGRDVRLTAGYNHYLLFGSYLLLSLVLIGGSFTAGFLLARAVTSNNLFYTLGVVLLILLLLIIFILLLFRCRRARRVGDVNRNGYADEWED